MKKQIAAIFFILFVFGFQSGFLAGDEQRRPLTPLDPKPDFILKAQIASIEPLYDDCRLLFSLKGKFFGAGQGTRIVRMQCNDIIVDPEIRSWGQNQVDCLLKGDFKLGRTYLVFIWDTVKKKDVSNKSPWHIKAQVNQLNRGVKSGEEVFFSGDFLGNTKTGKQVWVGNISAVIAGWYCEDFNIIIPQLAPGKYPMVLKEGALVISNTITLTIQ